MIDSAVALFSDKGVDNVSVRELTSHAQVNVAAINYHFGSKEQLAELVFEQLTARISKSRADELERVLAAAKARASRPELESIVRAFIRPYVDLSMRTEGALLAQFILQHRLRPSAMTARLIGKYFDPLARAFIDAMAQACPAVPRTEFYWRYTFMVSTVVLTVSDTTRINRLVRLSDGKADPSDTTALEGALTRFLLGALSAPKA
ncbi:TetR family transcriptional regulator [Bradyrhizobium sp. LHD-71]|uniref:TetR/AcrR family transcriptional regulator n=1 Tax=Bradyrhizobium sp. LHD-71 TaxID=3072141 RepID=UPI00280F8096|nr:TetR family transcriptional regulator [Bradyrhizobium sp. LHD-71]MDQ8729340.1 TetR family transcriptional regulator [Bradyrhizobium sp. LHD-71]